MKSHSSGTVPRPNIVLCVMDDHRHDALGAAGHPVLRTPFLDRLASEGVRFTQAYLPGGTRAAVCAPSRAMLHSGRSLFRLQGAGGTIPAEHPTLGEILRATGYYTFHTGKWHNDKASFNRAFADGDEIFLGGMNDPWSTPLFRYDPGGVYASKLPFIRNPQQSNAIEQRRGDHVHSGIHCTDIFCDRAAAHIRDYDRREPFFLSLALMAPHDPRTAPPDYHALYDPEQTPLPENFAVNSPVDTGDLLVRDETLAAHPRDPAEVRRHLADYHAMITHLDDGLARVMGALEERGWEDNTWFVFTADHGLSLGSHGLMGKQNLYEESVRVPLMIRAPGLAAGARREDPVWHLDLYPTLCRAAGVAPPETVEGRDLHPESTEPASPRTPDELYFGYGSTIRAVREGPLKLIEYVRDGYRTTQLFHLEDDPHETCDLAALPNYRADVLRLRKALRVAAERTGDTAHPTGERFWCRFPEDRPDPHGT